MNDGGTTIVLVEAAIELAIMESASVKLTLRAAAPGGERERVSGAPRRIEVTSNEQIVVLATPEGEVRVPLARVIGARRL